MTPRELSTASLAARDAELVSLARNIIAKEGISALNMDKLVAAAAYSKGTVYKHFTSKEDLVIAICNTCIIEITTFFDRAASFNGSSRERIVVIMLSYLIWVRSHQAELLAVLSSHSPAVISRASTTRLEQRDANEQALMTTVIQVIQNGIADGDLALPTVMTPKQITFALWSSGFGVLALISSKAELAPEHGLQLEREYFCNIELILDGLNWSPLSTHYDYQQTLQRAAQSLFTQELQQLSAKGHPLIL